MSGPRDPLDPPRTPRPSRRDSKEIVEAVVIAAMELGGQDPSVNTIAKRAGVGVASLYRYFPNKGAIYSEISKRLQEAFLRDIQAVLANTSLTLEEGVRACCEIAVKSPGVDPSLRQTLNKAYPPSWNAAAMGAVISRVVDEVCDWLDRLFGERSEALRHRVFVAVAAGRGLVMMSRLFPELSPSDDELVEHMFRTLMVHLSPSATSGP